MSRLLLGILDKATLRLGDNTTVDFEKTPSSSPAISARK